MGKNQIGKLVVVAHWSDFDLMDATKLGVLQRVHKGYFYIEDDVRGYRYCRPVSNLKLRRKDYERLRKNNEDVD